MFSFGACINVSVWAVILSLSILASSAPRFAAGATGGGPLLQTSDGDLDIRVESDKRVSILPQGEPETSRQYVQAASHNSVIEALKLGYQLGQAASASDLQSVIDLQALQARIDALDTRITTSAAQTLQSAGTQFAGAIAQSEATLSARITATTNAINKHSACSGRGEFLGSDGTTCTKPPGGGVVAADGCTAETAGAVRFFAKDSIIKVCALNDKTKKYEFASGVGVADADLGLTADKAVDSCKSLQDAGITKSGVYYLKDIGRVFCLQSDLDKAEGGGWALAVSNTDQYHYVMTLRGSHVRNYEWVKSNWGTAVVPSPTGGSNTRPHGTHPLLDKIVPKAKSIMMTGSDHQPFLAAHFPDGGAQYWSQILSQSTSCGRTRVQYFKSNSPGKDAKFFANGIKYIEACAPYPWGHRASNTHVNYGIASGSCSHICWMDVASCCRDRPFAHCHCGGCSGSQAWCPVYDRSPSWYQARGGRRAGTMAYRILFRW